jgi:hypothetical protein
MRNDLAGDDKGWSDELHEFHVGNGCASPVGHGDTAAGGDVGVAGVNKPYRPPVASTVIRRQAMTSGCGCRT